MYNELINVDKSICPKMFTLAFIIWEKISV